MLDKGQQWGQQKYHQAQAPFKSQNITRLEHVPKYDPDPEYPPGFDPAVRVHSTLDFPGLASESIKRHLSVPNLGSSTSAAGQLSFSLATAKSNEAPLPPTLSKIPMQTPDPPNEPLRRMPPGLKVTRQAAMTAPLPSHTHTADTQPDSHEKIRNDAHEAAHCVEPQQPGSSNQQPKQQGWDLHSVQSHQAPQQSGWDVDSDSEPDAAWTPFGNNLHSRGTHSQQANEATSIPESGWRPDQYQGTAAMPTSSFTPSRLHKLQQQQQRTHSTHQYSPEPLARSPISVSKGETEPHQKTPIRVGGWNPDIFQGQKSPVRVGGWNPDRYQGTGAAGYNDAVDSTVEEQQHPSLIYDDSHHKALSYAFPKAYRPHSSSETRRLSSAPVLAEQSDPNLDDTPKRMYLQCHASSSASSRQNLELVASDDGNPHVAAPLFNRKAGLLSWDDSSSQGKPEASSPFPGGFGLRPSQHARNLEGTCARSSSHHFPSSASEKDSIHSSSSLHVTNGSAYDDPSGYDKQDQQHLLSRQHIQDSDQLEWGVPMWGDSEGGDAEGGDPEEANQLEGEVPLWSDSEGEDAVGCDPEGVNPEGVVDQGADHEGCDSGYTTQVAQDYEPELLQYLRQEPKELEWVTARPKRDKSRSATYAQEPLALLDRYCAEGKMLRSHIDDRCLDYMTSLHPDIQCQALTEFANYRSKEVLSNPPAYFMSLLKGLQSRAHIPASLWEKKQAQHVLTVPKPKPKPAVAATISPEAQQKLAELYTQGILGPALLDQHCLGLLARLPQSAQLIALTRLAANISEASDKRGYVSQLLTHMLSRADDFNLRLDPGSFCYDANLAMCWRVLTKQEKREWQGRLAKGKQIRLDKLSHPRQVLAQQLHRNHSQRPTAAAAAWKRTDAATKDALLLSADQTGEAIKLVPDEQPSPGAAGPEFHESDFPPLGRTTYSQQAPGWNKPMPSGNSSLQGAGVSSDGVPSDKVPSDKVPCSGGSSNGNSSSGVPSAADQTGKAIKLVPDEQPNPKAAEPEFHESDFPPLGMTAQLQHGPGCRQAMPSGNSSLQGAGVPATATGAHGSGSTKPMFVPSMPATPVPQPTPSNPSGDLHSARSGDGHNAMKDTQSLCIVCFEIKPLCMYVPCGHIAVCTPCSQAVLEQTSSCPVCQQAIRSVQELFFA